MCSFDARSEGQSGDSLEPKDVMVRRKNEAPRLTRVIEDKPGYPLDEEALGPFQTRRIFSPN